MSQESLQPVSTLNQDLQVRDSQVAMDRPRRRGNYKYDVASIEEDSQQIRQILRTLLRHKITIIVCVMVVMTVTGLALSRVQPMYEASSQIQIDPEKAPFTTGGKMVFAANVVDPEYYNTQLRKLTSTTLLLEVAKKLKLDQEPEFLDSGPTTIGAALSDFVRSPRGRKKPARTATDALPKIESSTDPSDINAEMKHFAPYIGKLASGIQISAVPRTRLVRVTFQHHLPEFTQKVANAIVEVFVERNVSDRTQTNKVTQEFLTKTVARLETEINQEEKKLAEYLKSHKQLSLDQKDNPTLGRLQGQHQSLLTAENDRITAQAQYEKSLQLPADSLEEMARDPELSGLRNKRLELIQRRTELLNTYTEEHPEVKQIDQSLAEIEPLMEKQRKIVYDQIKARFEVAKKREDELRSQTEQSKSEIITQNETSIMQRMMNDTIENKKKLLQSILTTNKETEIGSQMDMNNIFVSETAELPGAPVSPRIPYTLLVSFFASLSGGVGLAFLREYLNNRIKSVEDVDRIINLPTLGLIPMASQKALSKGGYYYGSNGRTGEELVRLSDGEFVPADFDIGLRAFALSNSQVGEAYRQLRTSILLSSSEDQRNRIILFTSSQPGEGKTTSSFNTAISLAQTGASVLIVDCDLRRPQLHKVLKAGYHAGLSRYLSGQCKADDIFVDSSIPHLTVVPCGQLPPNPAELLGSQRMRSLLAYAIEKFDYIILDSPPLLSFADATILSALADSVVLVVHSERSKREIVKRACRKLDEANTRTLGVVLNSISLEQSSYYGYDYYGY
jgi:capsular exopolysaccharide synthesis family protein